MSEDPWVRVIPENMVWRLSLAAPMVEIVPECTGGTVIILPPALPVASIHLT